MQLRSTGLTWQEIDGDLVILDLERSVYLTTNNSGAFLAKLLTQDRSFDDLVDALTAEYSISRAAASADTERFVASLSEKKLLL